MLIYRIHNKITGKSYVGQTKVKLGRRISSHKHNGSNPKVSSPLYNSIRKYGWDNFEVTVLQECTNVEELNEGEKKWISYYNSLVPNGYNVEGGGFAGKIMTEEIRAKIGSKSKGRIPSAESRAKMSLAHRTNSTRGENTSWSKLTEQQVKDIKSEYFAGGTSYIKLGAKYNVTWGAIRNIIKKRTWKHVN